MEVEASAGPGALADEFVIEKARWFLPEGMIRYEGDASPDDLRILRVRGNSMEPEMREGDRLMVDVARRIPATGEMFVLWDGAGLVVKRIEHVRDADPPRLRLKSTNPDYDDYTCDPEEAHIVGSGGAVDREACVKGGGTDGIANWRPRFVLHSRPCQI